MRIPHRLPSNHPLDAVPDWESRAGLSLTNSLPMNHEGFAPGRRNEWRIDHPKWKVQVVWRIQKLDIFMKPFITRRSTHYGNKASNESCQLDHSSRSFATRDWPEGRSVEESIPPRSWRLSSPGNCDEGVLGDVFGDLIPDVYCDGIHAGGIACCVGKRSQCRVHLTERAIELEGVST
jgi:hypothetical protein